MGDARKRVIYREENGRGVIERENETERGMRKRDGPCLFSSLKYEKEKKRSDWKEE